MSVVLPTLDEADIDRVLSEIIAEGEKASLDLEVIVDDDGSADGTRERVRAWESRDPRVRLLAREGERGLAQAVLAEAVLGKACAAQEDGQHRDGSELPITFRDRAHGASKLGAGVECARAPWRPLWRRPSSGTSSRGTSSAGRGRRSR